MVQLVGLYRKSKIWPDSFWIQFGYYRSILAAPRYLILFTSLSLFTLVNILRKIQEEARRHTMDNV